MRGRKIGPAATIAVILLGMLAVVPHREAQSDDHRQTQGILIATHYVGFGKDTDVIRVGKDVGKFHRLRMHVSKNDIYIERLEVIRHDKTVRTIRIGRKVKKDDWTRWYLIDWPGEIDRIALYYRSRPSFRGQAVIGVYAQYRDDWLGVEGEGRRHNEGWVLLGAQSAGFFGFDSDRITIGTTTGPLTQIKIVAKDRAITLDGLSIQYANGDTDDIPTKAKVKANGVFGPIDLKDGPRPIDTIKLRYRSRIFDSDADGAGRAVVQVWGHY